MWCHCSFVVQLKIYSKPIILPLSISLPCVRQCVWILNSCVLILDPLQYYFQAFFSSSFFSTRHCLSPVLKKRIIVCDLYLTAPAFFPENTRPTAWLSQNGLCFFQSIICKSIWWRLKDALKSSHCILSICLDRHGIWLSGQSCLVRILPEPLLKGQTFIYK